jgi:hypothetical protein
MEVLQENTWLSREHKTRLQNSTTGYMQEITLRVVTNNVISAHQAEIPKPKART